MRRLRSEESGFTLVELLMSTLIGVGVLLVAFALSDSVLHAQVRITDRTEAIAGGRTTMEQVVQQLRSQVCLAPGQPAISYGDDSEVTFYADLANTTFVPQRRDLTLAGSTLTEQDYDGALASSGTVPYTFSASPSRTRVLGEDLGLQNVGGVNVPFFSYYAFDNATPVRPSRLLATPLSASDAARVVRIGVSFDAHTAHNGATIASSAEPFTADVFVRTADPSDPDHSPLCI